MSAPIIPWQPSNIPSEIQQELNRRKVNRSFNYVNNKVGWKSGEWNKYKGPMLAWVRMCSNGAGHPLVGKPRFVLHGGKDFYTSYGYSNNVSQGSQQIIGWTPGNSAGKKPEPHIIETAKNKDYPIGIPNPEITKIDCTIQKELYRRATVEWNCFSWKQLEYMTPYFMVPRITIMLEWGWNHFNPVSLVDISDIQEMRNLFGNPYPLYTDNILKSNGNYDVLYGFVTNFNWSVEGNKIVCSTEITSKDRLYAGVTKDSTLHLSSAEGGEKDNQDGCLQSIQQFLSADDTIGNFLKLINTPWSMWDKIYDNIPNAQPIKEIVNSLMILEQKWSSDLNEDDTPAEKKATLKEINNLRLGYMAGIFQGRGPKNSAAERKLGFRSDKTADWDNNPGTTDKAAWINMGMVVEILNHFSKRKGVKDSPMFEVDVTYSVVSAHPNLISCDQRVLIPNYKAPKFHVGSIGDLNVGKDSADYINQYKGDGVTFPISNNADRKLAQVFYQGVSNCFRNNLDRVINVNRYMALGNKVSNPLEYSFPSADTKTFASGQTIKKDFSGLLSNIYISFEAFKEIVSNKSNKTYNDIYNAIFSLLRDATNSFWDLTLVENQKGKLTIVDRNYSGQANFGKKDGSEEVYDFSYYDADSLIKTLKFRPQLSDAQATRAIYSTVNNPNANTSYSDRNDLLDYKFLDAVILPKDEKDSTDVANTKQTDMREQLKNTLRGIQTVSKKDDKSLQMTIALEKSPAKPGVTPSPYEIVKLVMPSSAQSLLNEILDDKDYQNNPRYCAIQPGITAELSLEGIGGLRTFQYFRIRNLPEPYSHRNIIFRIIDVQQTVTGGVWETVIKAGILPLRKYIADQLNIKDFDEKTESKSKGINSTHSADYRNYA